MSFQAYHDTIKAKKGKTPEDIKKLAVAMNFLVERRQKNPSAKEGLELRMNSVIISLFYAVKTCRSIHRCC
ncbi:MAG: hypothetical protein RL432_519 [Bacteroidota bacterium]|jgi:hypothetical protein